MYSFKDKHPHGDSYCPQCNQLANLYTLCHCAPKCAKCTDQCINDSKLAESDGRCLTCGERYRTVKRKKTTYDCGIPKKVLMHVIMSLIVIGLVVGACYVESVQWDLVYNNKWLMGMMIAAFVIDGFITIVCAMVGLMESNKTYYDEINTKRVTVALLVFISIALLSQCIGVPVFGAFTDKYVPNVLTYALGLSIMFYPTLAIAIVIGVAYTCVSIIKCIYRSTRREIEVEEYPHRLA